jgi:hypothetical protein
MTLWDRLVPQAVLTLNLLCQAKADPKMSAYEFVNGKMDYNKMPLAPLGCAVQMHKSTNRRRTWDAHSLNGWYLGTSPKHYWCHNIFWTKTRAERISDTVFFQHWYLTQPVVTPADAIINAMKNLQSAIKNGPGNFEREEMDILRQMDAILQYDKKQASKHVTFTAETVQAKPAMHNRVVHPRVENTALRPRVDNALLRGITVAAVDKPYDPLHPMTTRLQVATQKLALAMHICPPTQSSCGSDFEAAMNVMENNLRSETTQAIFDEESGKLLKYRALLTHPKYRKAWTHSSANKFGRLAQGVGTRIKGTNTIFFIAKQDIPVD